MKYNIKIKNSEDMSGILALNTAKQKRWIVSLLIKNGLTFKKISESLGISEYHLMIFLEKNHLDTDFHYMCNETLTELIDTYLIIDEKFDSFNYKKDELEIDERDLVIIEHVA